MSTPASDTKPRPRGRPRAEDTAALEARLIRVASELFFDKGYGATAMSAVAAAAHVSKTTLWARFPSKAALFRAIVWDQINRWGRGANSTPRPSFDTLEEALLGFGDKVVRAGMASEFVHLNRLMYSESGRFPELAEAAAERFELGAQTIARIIRAFAKRDNVPCHNPDAAAEFFLMTLMGRASMVVLTNRNVSPDQAGEWLTRTVRTFMSSRPSW